MSRKAQMVSAAASRDGSGRWPRWLVRLHSVMVATTASVISGSVSFRRMSVAMNRLQVPRVGTREGETPGAPGAGDRDGSGGRGEGARQTPATAGRQPQPG